MRLYIHFITRTYSKSHQPCVLWSGSFDNRIERLMFDLLCHLGFTLLRDPYTHTNTMNNAIYWCFSELRPIDKKWLLLEWWHALACQCGTCAVIGAEFWTFMPDLNVKYRPTRNSYCQDIILPSSLVCLTLFSEPFLRGLVLLVVASWPQALLQILNHSSNHKYHGLYCSSTSWSIEENLRIFV